MQGLVDGLSNLLYFVCDLVDIDTANVGFLRVVTVATLQGYRYRWLLR